MKALFRNFLDASRRFRLSLGLSLLGLSVAFVVFILIMIQVGYDLGFDACQPDARSIYRLDVVQPKSSQAIVCRPLARTFVESSPHVVSGCLLSAWPNRLSFEIGTEDTRRTYEEEILSVTPSVLRVFRFEMLAGDGRSFDKPNSLLIPESMARRLFGTVEAVGQSLRLSGASGAMLVVEGVYKDFPGNSSLRNVIYTSMHPQEAFDDWENWSYYCFVRLDDTAKEADVLANFMENLDRTKIMASGLFGEGPDAFNMRLTSLRALHFLEHVDFDTFPKASRQTIAILLSVAFVVLLVAGVNFMNYSLALAPMRLRVINIQRVLGCSDRLLRGVLVLETVVISFLAYLTSLGLLYIVSRTSLVSLVDWTLPVDNRLMIVLGVGLIALLFGLLVGIYPAYYATAFTPALVLKGNFGLSPAGRRTRDLLLEFQFLVAFTLVITSFFMYAQNYYIRHASLGYERDQTLVVRLNEKINRDRSALVDRLRQYPEVEGVAFSQFLLGSQDQYMGWSRSLGDRSIMFQSLPVSSDFLDVMGIKLEAGRDFRPEDELKSTGCYLFNEKARALYDLKVGDKIEGAEIIGFVPDVKFASLRQEVSPMAFYLWGKYQWGREGNYYDVAYVRLRAGVDQAVAIAHAHEALAVLDGETSFEVLPMVEAIREAYVREADESLLIALFCLVAILLSIVGVFGAVMFECECRRQAIAIRRVFGATAGQVVFAFNLTYLKRQLFCFALAAPLAWHFVSDWLSRFAYRVPLYWWIWPLAFLLVASVTVLTISCRSWRAMHEDPLRNLHSE